MRAVVLVLAGLNALGGCSSEGASSPEWAYESARRAYEKRDWESYLRCYDPDIRENFIGFAILGAIRACGGDADLQKRFEELIGRHGTLDLSKPPKDAVNDYLAQVKSPPKLYSEVVQFTETWTTQVPVFFLGDLQGLTVSGDTASGTTTDSRSGRAWPVKMVKKKGKWWMTQ